MSFKLWSPLLLKLPSGWGLGFLGEVGNYVGDGSLSSLRRHGRLLVIVISSEITRSRAPRAAYRLRFIAADGQKKCWNLPPFPYCHEPRTQQTILCRSVLIYYAALSMWAASARVVKVLTGCRQDIRERTIHNFVKDMWVDVVYQWF